MYVKKMTYEDFNGNERTETLRFNFTQAQAAELQYSKHGGLREYLTKIIEANDEVEIMNYFKTLLLLAYGEISEDGRRFVKSEELSKAFSETQAYSDLYMLLATDSEEAAKFVNGITPKNLEDHKSKEEKNTELKVVSTQ